MTPRVRLWLAVFAALSLAPALALSPLPRLFARQSQAEGQRPVFRSGVDLVHVTVTVTDQQGHFVRGLDRGDFAVSEDGKPQPIVQFAAERAPVSLGIALDTSSSMAGARIQEAREALFRVIDDLRESDEVCFLTFSDVPRVRQGWTSDRESIRHAIEGAEADGRTALYDAVDQALHLMESGRYRKKVLLVVSDGNDTASFTPLTRLREAISESEALVYAIAVDSDEQRLMDGVRRSPRPPVSRQVGRPPSLFPPRVPPRGPQPGPGGGRPPWAPPPAPPTSRTPPAPQSDSANVAALRELTDISGGRTEVVRSSRDLGPATASVADELSQQYQLLYQAAAKHDGRWHAIDVTVRDASLRVRARKGYVAVKD